MKNVRLSKYELLRIVRDNKEKHVKEYNESVEDYIALATKLANDNKATIETKDLAKIKKIKSFPNPPTSYEDNYVRAIRMLELSVEDVIEIDATTFNQLVLDEWQWKAAFEATSTFYKTGL